MYELIAYPIHAIGGEPLISVTGTCSTEVMREAALSFIKVSKATSELICILFTVESTDEYVEIDLKSLSSKFNVEPISEMKLNGTI